MYSAPSYISSSLCSAKKELLQKDLVLHKHLLRKGNEVQAKTKSVNSNNEYVIEEIVKEVNKTDSHD